MDEIAGVLRQQSQAVEEDRRRCRRRGRAGGRHRLRCRRVVTVGASEATIAAQFADLDPRNVPNAVLHRAKADHMLWKKHLAERLVGHQPRDQGAVGSPRVLVCLERRVTSWISPMQAQVIAKASTERAKGS